MGWDDRIKEWADARGLLESTPERQMVKLFEEVDELQTAIRDKDHTEMVDAIGDCCVVLAIIAAQIGLPLTVCQEAAYHEIKNRTGKTVDGVFVKE